jgi:copper chaperone NosL
LTSAKGFAPQGARGRRFIFQQPVVKGKRNTVALSSRPNKRGLRVAACGEVMKHFRYVFLIVLILTVRLVSAAEPTFVKPTPSDKCPVCGMFVAKYPDFVAEIGFKDGSYVVFDGTKDMFKYFLDMNKYERSRSHSDVKSVYVTNYYSLDIIDAYQAFYVMGSDVHGPMGNEFIPFDKDVQAQEFMRDHKGKSIVRFDEITREMIQKMD